MLKGGKFFALLIFLGLAIVSGWIIWGLALLLILWIVRLSADLFWYIKDNRS